MRVVLYCGLVLALAVQPSFADRAAYGGTRDLVARGVTITVRHHHDWSRIPIKDGAWVLHYTPATPFGVDEEISRVEVLSQGALVARTSSPPITYLQISDDDKYVIGLSNIKHMNDTQLVVFSSTGELLLKRGISAHLYCLDVAEYRSLRRKHRQAFDQLNRNAQLTRDSTGWREGDRVYLDIRGDVDEPYWPALSNDLSAALCESPLSANFSESTTNWIHWYSDTNPQPRVVEREGRPFEVRLRDPKGTEFGVKFEPTPLEPLVQ